MRFVLDALLVELASNPKLVAGANRFAIRPIDFQQFQAWPGQRKDYLNRLHDRRAFVGFLPDDELMRVVRQARNAMHELNVKLH